MTTFKLGDHWGALTITELFTEHVAVKSHGITEESDVQQVTVRCDCGETKTIPRNRFPHKRTMRDCGCGAANSTREMKTVLSVYITMATAQRITNYAAIQRYTKSHAAEELLSIGLAATES